ncbi:hypothetical protein NXF25_019119 [Crotalus adamanteus]|uniref:Helix-turn-helix domain-containing protein n=1 Tax=Crotalus adamanteus TaxID=8729 RepID=A0AAW1B0X4_CROAD
MGSPISGIIAEAVLQQLEAIVMSRYHPKFWANYVDDIFVIVKRRDSTKFLEELNSVYPDICFMAEEETQGSLAFLDVLISRCPNGTLCTSVYRKPTHTDRTLHYSSNHPIAHKISCIQTLFKRVNSSCSTGRAKVEEKKHLHHIFMHNGYPMGFVRQHSRPHRNHRDSRSNVTAMPATRTTLPYIHGVSEATARLLAPYNVSIAHRPEQTLRSKIMHPKEPLPNGQRLSVVYRINCKDCASNYVGETTKRLRTRVHEHELAIRRQEQRSQVWAHMSSYGHTFDLANTDVIARETTKGGHLLKEAWLSDENSTNRHIDLFPAYQTLRGWEKQQYIDR